MWKKVIGCILAISGFLGVSGSMGFMVLFWATDATIQEVRILGTVMLVACVVSAIGVRLWTGESFRKLFF